MKTQHEREVKTLSSNLGTLRFEMETMKKRVRDLDETNNIQQKRINGNTNILV